MAFTILTKNTTISASAVNDNFYHGACGNWMPLGGSSLAQTTGVYNIGSDNYKWNNAYINNLYVSNVEVESLNDAWNLISSYDINEQNSATSLIEFSINGETYDRVMISIYAPNHDSKIYMYCNSRTSTTYYGMSYLLFEGSTITAYNAVDVLPFVSLSCGSSGDSIYTTIHGNLKAGIYRSFQAKTVLCDDSEIYAMALLDIAYISSTDTITALKFAGTFNTGASIKIWGIA